MSGFERSEYNGFASAFVAGSGDFDDKAGNAAQMAHSHCAELKSSSSSYRKRESHGCIVFRDARWSAHDNMQREEELTSSAD